ALSKAKSFDWGIYHGYLYKSYYHWSSSELDSVISTMQQALEVAIRLQDAGKQSQCYARIAMAYTYLGNYTEAKKLTYKALEIAQNSNDWKGLYYAYYRLGNTYYYENDFNNALKNYLKVDSIFQHHDRKEPALAASLANIGSIYMEFKNFDRAREYFIESQELYKDMDREEGVVFSNFNLAKVEFNKGNYQESIDILEPALSYYQKINNRGELADISGWLGAAHLKLKQYQLAYENYKNSYQWSVDSGSKMLEANALVGLGEIAKIEGRPDRAIKDLENALVIYDSIKITYNKSQILNNLATAYSDKKEYQKALIYFQKFQKFEDSIKEVENIANFQNLETKYQTEKKEQEIALLNSEKELIEQQKVNQRNLLLGGIGISSLIGVLLFFQYRNRQKTNTKLKELDNLKSRFFANISHEFRTPLTLISNPIEKRLEAPKLTKTDRQDFEMISRNSQRLLNLVDQLLDLSKLEAGKYQLHVNKGDLGNLISAIAESFQYLAAQRHIIYKTEITDLKEVWFDKDVIEKTITNLLSNALKYTDEGGHVVLKASRKGDRAGITVENTASSLTPQILEKLFDRFYQADAHAEGAGIGLALVKELIGVYRGNIKVSKTPDSKLQFEVMLPIQKSAFKANEFTSEIYKSTPSSPLTTDAVSLSPEEFNELEADDDREIVLLAEDNAEVRQLLRSSFNSHYRIIEAE
ncbi:MAG: tetratricopeptide repeat protein, partial [Eudoraea sp.]|nr:tetratricopeptide repeat protein [Eudoraea sp.]